MSSVRYMEKLLDDAEVKWKTLGEICEKISSGKNTDKSDAGVYPVFGSTGVIGRTNNKVYQEEQILVARVGANAGRVNLAQGEYDVSDNTLIVKSKENIALKYLYYVLVNMNLNQFAQGAGQRLITASQLKAILIPVPSIAEQVKIIRILDAFTELTAALAAELTARKKQYNYYRDQLLGFKEGKVEWRTLGDLCSIGVGQARVGNEAGEYPFVNAGTTPSDYVSAYNTESNTITTPSRGQGGIGYVGYQTTHFWCGPLCYRIRSTTEMVTTRFVYHVMANAMTDIIGLANMTGVPALNKKDLVGFPVPIPSPNEQERIVAILDKFDALTNSITEGLPREIVLRQRQYEHYRNLLLSFPKPEGVTA